jgi:hypothetical protein
VSETDAELERAHARIAVLERMLGGPPAPRKAATWAAVLRWCALSATTVFIAGALAAGIAPRSELIVRAAPPPPPAPVPPGDLELFSPRFVWDTDGPALVDVEGKGSAHDLLVLAWHRGHNDRPMRVVALRRGTYEVLWRSEAFASPRNNARVSLAATDQLIALSDAFGAVQVLDVSSGRLLRTIHPPACERLATLASDGYAVFAVKPTGATSGHDPTTYRIDLVSGEVSPSPIPERRFLYECPVERSRGCRAAPLPGEKVKLRRLVSERAAEFGEDLVDDHDRITVFDAAMRPQLVDYQLFAWDLAGSMKWRAPAVPAPHRALQGAGSGSHHWLALANQRVVAIYLTGSNGYRVSAHDATTGELTYDIALPELPYGIDVERLTLDGDIGFITTTGALFVLDATAGRVTTTLRRF